jgi:valyl-tRNA synthetase
VELTLQQHIPELAPGLERIMIGTDQVFIQLVPSTDPEGDRLELDKEIAYLRGFLETVEIKLANEKFMANAKPELIEREKQKRDDALAKIKALESR